MDTDLRNLAELAGDIKGLMTNVLMDSASTSNKVQWKEALHEMIGSLEVIQGFASRGNALSLLSFVPKSKFNKENMERAARGRRRSGFAGIRAKTEKFGEVLARIIERGKTNAQRESKIKQGIEKIHEIRKGIAVRRACLEILTKDMLEKTDKKVVDEFAEENWKSVEATRPLLLDLKALADSLGIAASAEGFDVSELRKQFNGMQTDFDSFAERVNTLFPK